jgi:hypothetical protein
MTVSGHAAIVTPMSEPSSPDATWQPQIGPEGTGVLDRKTLPAEARDAILQAAASILSRGVSPHAPQDHTTGLVVGYVQSGKTLSFTSVIGLARDNDFPLVVVVAGTSKPLLSQSTQRLRKDLNIDDDFAGLPRWIHFKNPTDDRHSFISRKLDEWRHPQVPPQERPATVLITVMKNHRHLANLVALFRSLDLHRVPTLIVDDEADQASLNTLVNRGRESTTYAKLLELRSAAPCHTFLQYTATPQAPLLINIIDSLSPEFVEVLKPGDDYIGGQEFFGGRRDLVAVIPPEDIPREDNQLPGPPPSLLRALRIFLVGVAAGLARGPSPQNRNRSMLVHPSHRTAQHLEYHGWIVQAFHSWLRLWRDENDPDRRDLIEDFREAYDNLGSTVHDIPSFEDIVRSMPHVFNHTCIAEVNARGGPTPDVEWQQAYGWILVGGQAMDRGFTVEGLTVTYMPRGAGVGNADAIQQRARFFGYKRPYLGYCRIFLEPDALNAFEEYVRHEEEMRQELQRVSDEAIPLRDWKRVFILDPKLKPCRHNVIQHCYERGCYADEWFLVRKVEMPQEIAVENDAVVREFEGAMPFVPDAAYPSDLPAQQHLVADNIPLELAISKLLLRYRVADADDSQKMTGLLLQLAKALEENKTETARVYRMRPHFVDGVRDVDESGRISRIRQLFEGRTRVRAGGARRCPYPGDIAFYDAERVTVQIHRYDLRRKGTIVARQMPVIAVWVPARMQSHWIVQDQPRQGAARCLRA